MTELEGSPDTPTAREAFDDATDCRTEQGVLVGLIDGMIAQARVVAGAVRAKRPCDAVRHALADLSTDEDIALLTAARWRYPL